MDEAEPSKCMDVLVGGDVNAVQQLVGTKDGNSLDSQVSLDLSFQHNEHPS